MSDLPVEQLLSVDEAIAILDSVPVKPRVIRRQLLEAMGHRLAEDVHADRDYPPFDKALMDGFAVRAEDAASPGTLLKIVETIAAGQMGLRTVGPGESAGIMTGAPLPEGTNAVVPVEQIVRLGNQIKLQRPVVKGQSVAKTASDAPAGRMVLESGALLGPAQLAVAACVGRASLAVYDSPSVAILSTGDELVEIDRLPTGAQIRDSNSIMMHALLKQLGCRVRDLGRVGDDPAKIRSAIEDGLTDDVIFVTGGMSMGERDYVPRIFQETGLTPRISKLRIKPGKPFVFATGDRGQLAFGLPGNPVSAFVCTMRLASRLLNRLAGATAAGPLMQRILSGHLPANGPRELYLPACENGEKVEPRQPNGSADLFTLSSANCLILRPADAPAAVNGDHIVVIRASGKS